MRPFAFRLRALLTVRERAEQKALEQYAAALDALRTAGELRAAARQVQEEWQGQWRNDLARGSSGGGVHMACACGSAVDARMDRAETAIQAAQKSCRDALRGLLLARREREVVQRHLERQRLEYKRELGRSEQKELDELAQHRGPEMAPSQGSRQAYD